MGGAERIVSYISNELYIMGFEISIILFNSSEIFFDINDKIPIIDLKIANASKLNKILTLRKHIRHYRYNMVFVYSIKMALITAFSLFSFDKNIKLVAFERSNPFYSIRSNLKRVVINLALKRATKVVFLNDESSKFYSKSVQKKSFIIPNAVFNNEILEYKTSYEHRTHLKIVAVGRLTFVKRYDLMIEIFEIISSKKPNISLEIYGDGPCKLQINELIERKHLTDKIILKGNVINIPQQISDALVFLHTSESESWCNAIMEALAMGIPVVAFDCDFGPRQMIKSGYNGYLIEMNNIYTFASKVLFLLENFNTSMIFSINAEKIVQTFSPKMVLEKYLELIEGIKNG